MQTKLSKWGNSYAVRIPMSVVNRLGLQLGQTVEVDLKQQIDPTIQDIYPKTASIGEQIAWCKAHGFEEPETVDWGPDVGNEILPDEDWSDVFAECPGTPIKW